MTRPTVEVLRLLLAASAHEPLWAARISEQTAVGKSTVSQILARLAERQWVSLRQEPGSHPGRPARVLCALTQQGRREARAALAAQWAGCPQHVRGGLTEVNKPTSQESLAPSAVGGRCSAPLPDVESLRRNTAAEPVGGDAVRSVDAAERMATLREALKAFQTLNEILTSDFLARSAVGREHGREHWNIMNGFLAEARAIRDKALRAHSN